MPRGAHDKFIASARTKNIYLATHVLVRFHTSILHSREKLAYIQMPMSIESHHLKKKKDYGSVWSLWCTAKNRPSNEFNMSLFEKTMANVQFAIKFLLSRTEIKRISLEHSKEFAKTVSVSKIANRAMDNILLHVLNKNPTYSTLVSSRTCFYQFSRLT